MDFQVQPAGEEAIVLSVSYDRTRDCVVAVQNLSAYITSHPHPAIRSVRRALDSLLLQFVPHPTFNQWLDDLKAANFYSAEQAIRAQERTVPICYDLGYDLPQLSEQTGLSANQIVEMHAAVEYEVWMIGFMPGFPYMGELPAQLQVARKNTPDVAIPAGSVAIAEEYVGIYPFQSPGGWHVIGRTPLTLVDYGNDVPWEFDYGMKVRFQPISRNEFESMRK